MFGADCDSLVTIRVPSNPEGEAPALVNDLLVHHYLLPAKLPDHASDEPDADDQRSDSVEEEWALRPSESSRRVERVRSHIKHVDLMQLPLGAGTTAVHLANPFSVHFVDQVYARYKLPFNNLIAALVDTHCGGVNREWWGGVVVTRHSNDGCRSVVHVTLHDIALLNVVIALCDCLSRWKREYVDPIDFINEIDEIGAKAITGRPGIRSEKEAGTEEAISTARSLGPLALVVL
ncbi:hypothetical protein BV22DRAFT_1051562 [Leucogyrophana mollusca]|uniref:Uncharacterized protein n=1 Tax=Leucogyrophana mollusca TaxID=85980 RepID=A0ACB8AZJ8_9AGAM|nr:hypothetical protein BV22DRAFT_1051562 [Leucogyrophana mollusca]